MPKLIQVAVLKDGPQETPVVVMDYVNNACLITCLSPDGPAETYLSKKDFHGVDSNEMFVRMIVQSIRTKAILTKRPPDEILDEVSRMLNTTELGLAVE
jgi:hypothetical protein